MTNAVNRNLNNSENSPKKDFRGFNGIRTRGLCVSAAVLSQLSYEDPYTGDWPIYKPKDIPSMVCIYTESRFMYQSIPSAIIPPSRATPGHLTPVQLQIVGHLTRQKNAGHWSRVKRILYSMSQVITPDGFRQHIC